MPWNRSWPRFRHLLTATLKKMAFVPLDVAEDEYVSSYNEVDDWLKLRYLNDGYFIPMNGGEDTSRHKNDSSKQKRKKIKQKIYWASIDITKFYPNINMRKLCDDMLRHCKLISVDTQTGEILVDKRTQWLLQVLTSFRIHDDGIMTKDELELMGLDKDNLAKFNGLPTGLLVGGWLANIYLLDSDLRIASRLEKERSIAHFRYVDDHTFVSTSPKALVKWIRAYVKELCELGLEINTEKFTPNPFILEYKVNAFEGDDVNDVNSKISLADVVLTKNWPDEFLETEDTANIENWSEYSYYIDKVTEKCEIDPLFPSPLMTQTLEKISQIGSLDLALLSKRETKMVEHDLKTLIVADLPDEEIKEDTRVSFASTFLSRITISSSMDFQKLQMLRSAWSRKCNELKEYLIGKLLLPKTEENHERNKEIQIDIESNINELKREVFDIPVCGISNWKIKRFVYPHSEDYVLTDNEKRIWNEANKIGDAINALYYATTEKIISESNRVFYLLVKAANKVPDKLKIWIRLVEFCIIHVPSKIRDVLMEINSHRNTHLHSKECDFVISQLFSVISNRIVRLAWDAYLQSKDKEKANIQIDEQFRKIKEIASLDPLKSKATYSLASQYLYSIAINFHAYLEAILHGENCLYCTISDDVEGKLFEILWIIEGLPFKEQKTFNILSFFDLQWLDNTTIDNLYIQLITKIVTSDAKYNDVQRKWVVEILAKFPEHYLKDIWDIRYNSFNRSNNEIHVDGYISLKSLIELFRRNDGKSYSQKEENSWILSSEMVCLKIIQSAISKYSTPSENNIIPEHIIDIRTTLVKIDDLKRLWKSENPSDISIDVVFKTDSEISEDQLSSIITNNRAKELYRFGVMLYELLSKEADIEWLKFRSEYFYEWPSIIRKLHTSGRIGSFCERLLSGCLLPTTRALLDMSVTTSSVENVNYYYSPVFVSSINAVQNMIDDYFKTLTEGITRISGNQRIELKFIDLK